MRTYRRDTIDSLPPTDSHSARYWRKDARDTFARYPNVHTVQIVDRKTDSPYLPRGVQHPPEGVVVVHASSGGSFGRSRRDYYPEGY
jgi:hypothetical protein